MDTWKEINKRFTEIADLPKRVKLAYGETDDPSKRPYRLSGPFDADEQGRFTLKVTRNADGELESERVAVQVGPGTLRFSNPSDSDAGYVDEINQLILRAGELIRDGREDISSDDAARQFVSIAVEQSKHLTSNGEFLNAAHVLAIAAGHLALSEAKLNSQSVIPDDQASDIFGLRLDLQTDIVTRARHRGYFKASEEESNLLKALINGGGTVDLAKVRQVLNDDDSGRRSTVKSRLSDKLKNLELCLEKRVWKIAEWDGK